MIDEVYRIGAHKRLRDLVKEAGARHALGGALLGGLLGYATGPAVLPLTPLGVEPERILGFPASKGQLEHSEKINRIIGAMAGSLAGAGLGTLASGTSSLLDKIRGEKVKKILDSGRWL